MLGLLLAPCSLQTWSTAEVLTLPSQVFFEIKKALEGEGWTFTNGIREQATKRNDRIQAGSETIPPYASFPRKGCILPAPMEIWTSTCLEVQTLPLCVTFSCSKKLLYVKFMFH